MFLTTHLAPAIMRGPTTTSGVILYPNILRECIALITLQYFITFISSFIPLDVLQFPHRVE